jgi:hypothetical protein
LAGQVAMRHSAAITQSSTPTLASNSQQICCNAMNPHKAIVLPNPNRVSFNSSANSFWLLKLSNGVAVAAAAFSERPNTTGTGRRSWPRVWMCGRASPRCRSRSPPRQSRLWHADGYANAEPPPVLISGPTAPQALGKVPGTRVHSCRSHIQYANYMLRYED